MSFEKSFDELLNSILTDWRNQFPDADMSQGSMIFLKSACMASALWGLYKYQGWVAKQIFPDTSDTEALEHHAWVRGLTRTAGETDAAYLARLLDWIQRPPAGGNKYDYVKWAMEIDNVANAWCIPLAQGLGTVDVIILANATNTLSEIPSSSSRIGLSTSASAGKLIDSGAAFLSGRVVDPGYIVENPIRGLSTQVTAVDSGTQLSLQDDIFKFANEPYIIYMHTGTNTLVSLGQLIDSSAAFNNSTYTIKKGDVVENLTDGLQATVDGVVNATQIVLKADIFQATGKKYVIRSMVAQVKKHVDALRPVTASNVRILGPTIVTQAVTMSAVNGDKAAMATDIAAYLNGLIAGQPLYVSQLQAIAIDDGADNAAVTTPATDVTPTAYQILRPGAISVT